MDEIVLPDGAWVMDSYFVATFPYGPPDGVPNAVAAVILKAEGGGSAIMFLSADGWRQFVHNVLQSHFMMQALAGRQN